MHEPLGRRAFLKTGTLVGLGTAALAGTSPAVAAETTIAGTIIAESNAKITDGRVYVYGGETLRSGRVDEFGRFRIDVPTNEAYELAFYKTNPKSESEIEKNGVPHIYEFGEFPVGEDSKYLELVAPRAYVVDFRVLDDDGEPFTGAELRYVYDGWGIAPRRASVNDEGYVVVEGASFTGAEFADHVALDVDDDRKRMSVDGPTTVTAVVGPSGTDWKVERNDPTVTTGPDDRAMQTLDSTRTSYPAPATRPSDGGSSATSTTSATETPRRGSPSNDGTSGGFVSRLSDPLYPTVGGFTLLAAGIVYRFVKRQ